MIPTISGDQDRNWKPGYLDLLQARGKEIQLQNPKKQQTSRQSLTRAKLWSI